jgi:hypothetical protein
MRYHLIPYKHARGVPGKHCWRPCKGPVRSKDKGLCLKCGRKDGCVCTRVSVCPVSFGTGCSFINLNEPLVLGIGCSSR